MGATPVEVLWMRSTAKEEGVAVGQGFGGRWDSYHSRLCLYSSSLADGSARRDLAGCWRLTVSCAVAGEHEVIGRLSWAPGHGYHGRERMAGMQVNKTVPLCFGIVRFAFAYLLSRYIGTVTILDEGVLAVCEKRRKITLVRCVRDEVVRSWNIERGEGYGRQDANAIEYALPGNALSP
jgi:hypothetical protein